MPSILIGRPSRLSTSSPIACPFLGIAVLNWLSRDSAPSALRAVLLANLVGFGAVAANDVWGVATGEAREAAKIFLVVHLAFAIAFAVAVRKNVRAV